MRGGRTYWVPVGETTNVTSFSRWEQAFRVFSDIYNRHQPDRSTELIQYNHIIHTASLTYVWENVYTYDKDFRLHMSRHPDCSWGIILQQAWAMRLKDKVFHHENNNQHGAHGRNSAESSGSGDRRGSGFNVNNICRRFNKLKCTSGSACRYEHRCLYCFKVGHAIVNCRKLAADKGNNRNSD